LCASKAERPRAAFDAKAARALIRSADRVALATRRRGDGGPQVGLTSVATDLDGSPILLLSELADHTRNIGADGRVALLFDGSAGHSNPQTGPRVSVQGVARPSDLPRHRARFLARHDGARLYAGFADFHFFHVDVAEARLVGGFAQARTLTADGLLYQGPWSELAEAETEILAHMNDAHRDALALIARATHGSRGKHYRMTAIDPEGCELRVGHQRIRVDFPETLGPIGTALDARRVLVALTHNARESAAKNVVLQRSRD
jgi:putative heme iron utilization protein